MEGFDHYVKMKVANDIYRPKYPFQKVKTTPSFVYWLVAIAFRVSSKAIDHLIRALAYPIHNCFAGLKDNILGSSWAWTGLNSCQWGQIGSGKAWLFYALAHSMKKQTNRTNHKLFLLRCQKPKCSNALDTILSHFR